jgi:prepilin-type N-terminal cleavage/methylation domain-containing protein
MKKGFTLIELLVVISIIAVLSAVILANMSKGRSSAEYTRRLNDLHQVNLSLERYYTTHNFYPKTNSVWFSTQGCLGGTAATAWIPNLVSEKYAVALPKDTTNPTESCSGIVYLYKSDTRGFDYKIIMMNNLLDTASFTAKNPEMKDPVTSRSGSYGFWTPKAANY